MTRPPRNKGDGLRVFFAVRDDLREQRGGDTAQILGTAAALGDLGVRVTISCDDRADLRGFDCVHLWHLERVHETFVHLLNARRYARPTVLSTIYWPRGDEPMCAAPGRLIRRGRREDLKNVARLMLARSHHRRRAILSALRKGWLRCRRELLHSARVVLPNSRAEAEVLCLEAGRELRFRVVPNAVNVSACREALRLPGRHRRRGALCVGQFDPRKNQLALLGALAGTDVEIGFIGRPRPMHRRYYNRCRRAAGANARFMGQLDTGEVLSRLRGARVHVCPSRLETPGLANLEAAAMGCVLVVPDCPPVREYFADEAIYFQPDDPASLRRAVLSAFEAEPPANLAERVMTQFTWPKAAEATMEAYHQAISEF